MSCQNTRILLFKVSEQYATNIRDREGKRCRRWRAERDWWLSVLNLILWLVISTVRKLLNENEELLKKMDRELEDEKQTIQTLQELNRRTAEEVVKAEEENETLRNRNKKSD